MPALGLGDTTLDRVLLRTKRLKANVSDAVLDASVERTIDGASTFSLTLHDPDRDLLTAPHLFTSRVDLTYDDLLFEMVSLSYGGGQLQVGFESAGVGVLRRQRGKLVAKGGTTTRTAFARRLVGEVKWLKFKGEKGDPAKVALARGGSQGGSKNENSWDALGRLAGDRQWRRFESEGTIYFGSDAWLAKLTEPLVIDVDDAAVLDATLDYDSGKRAETCSLTVLARTWASRPGAPVTLRGMGELGRGLWLVESLGRSVFSPTTGVSLTRKTKALPEPKPEKVGTTGDHSVGKSGGSSRTGTSSSGFQWPLQGPITSDFGPRSGGTHYGIDIGVPNGTPVYAAADGRASAVGSFDPDGYGVAIYLEHDGGWQTRYGHLQSVAVTTGLAVKRGQLIGRSNNTGSSTGPHLHFETRRNGVAVDPLTVLP